MPTPVRERSVLFVCTGNMCRSPMAAAWLKHRMGAAATSWQVRSAGLAGIEGAPATKEAIQVLEEHEIELDRHRSQGVTPELLAGFGHVVVMTSAQRSQLLRRCPPPPDLRLLRAFEAGKKPWTHAPDLPDPVLRPIAEYRECFRIIQRCVDHYWQWLEGQAEAKTLVR